MIIDLNELGSKIWFHCPKCFKDHKRKMPKFKKIGYRRRSYNCGCGLSFFVWFTIIDSTGCKK